MSKMYQNSLVSIIVPAWNRDTLLLDTLKSVLSQTYPKWQCLVVDDGSEAESLLRMRQFVKQDKRFQMISRDRNPKGGNTCRNIGLNKAKGEYVMFLDSDDVMLPDCLEKRVKFATQHPEADAWVFASAIFDHFSGQVLSTLELQPYTEKNYFGFLLQNPWLVNGCFMRNIWGGRDSITFREKMPRWQEWDFYIRYIQAGFVVEQAIDWPYDVLVRAEYNGNRVSTKKTISTDEVETMYESMQDIYNSIPKDNSILQSSFVYRMFYLFGYFLSRQQGWAISKGGQWIQKDKLPLTFDLRVFLWIWPLFTFSNIGQRILAKALSYSLYFQRKRLNIEMLEQ